MTEIWNLLHKGGSLADPRYKEKERKGRSWEIVEKITREEYALDWSQYKVFLVVVVTIAYDIKLYDCCQVYEDSNERHWYSERCRQIRQDAAAEYTDAAEEML